MMEPRATVGEKAEPTIVDSRQRLFELLMSEKEQADKQIGAYLELQLKLHTFIFAGAAAGAGWAFAKGEGGFSALPEVRAISALTVAFLGIFAVLQAVVNYGIVLGYIRYKHQLVGRKLQDLLQLRSNPLAALRSIASWQSNVVVMVASVASGSLLLGGSAGLIAYAGFALPELRTSAGMLQVAVFTCSLFWVVAAGVGLALLRAIAELKRDVSTAEKAAANQPTPPDG